MALIKPLATKSADPSFKNVHRLGFASYVATVREALVNARTKAVIVTPFIDDAGIDFLRESWETRSAKDCEWEVYVRSVEGKLERMASKYKWKLYEYPVAGDAGMHAKIVSIDDQRLILGSMNLLKRNMYTNLELGIEVSEDPIVWKLSKLENWLKEASKARF